VKKIIIVYLFLLVLISPVLAKANDGINSESAHFAGGAAIAGVKF